MSNVPEAACLPSWTLATKLNKKIERYKKDIRMIWTAPSQVTEPPPGTDYGGWWGNNLPKGDIGTGHPM